MSYYTFLIFFWTKSLNSGMYFTLTAHLNSDLSRLSSHMWLVAPVLNDTAWDRKEVGEWTLTPRQCAASRVEETRGMWPPHRPSFSYRPFSHLAAPAGYFQPNQLLLQESLSWSFWEGQRRSHRDWISGAYTCVRAVLPLHTELYPAFWECECVYAPVCFGGAQAKSTDPQRAPWSCSPQEKLSFLHNNRISQGTRDGTFHSNRMFCKDCQMESVSWKIIRISSLSNFKKLW